VFWWVTLLGPVGFALLMLVPVLSALWTDQAGYEIWVQGGDAGVRTALVAASSRNLSFEPAPEGTTLDSLKARVLRAPERAILILPEDLSRAELTASLYTARTPSVEEETELRQRLREVVRTARLSAAGLTAAQIRQLDFSMTVATTKLEASGAETDANAAAGYVFGYLMAFLSYLMVNIYGSIVLRAVIEEKANRILEVLVSSIEPFRLMLGKILGVGLVALTQLGIWVVLTLGLVVVVQLVLLGSGLSDDVAAQAAEQAQAQAALGQRAGPTPSAIKRSLEAFNPSILLFFLVYFIGGYLQFGALFAAIGASVDQESDGQQLSTLVVLPLIVPIMLLPGALGNPNGSMAFWLSMVPLSSPIGMLVRLAGGQVAWWEVLLSLGLLYGTALGCIWLAGRIYRIGLLTYGQKPAFKTLWQWLLKPV
jgi:ABC-2 type transport system permease protein